MLKKNIFKGLGTTFASLLAITAFMSSLAFQRAADINLFLGITRNSGSSEKSKYESEEKKLEAEEAYNIQTEAEGSVLLRNKGNALPLAANSRVTLFGNASVDSIYHGGSGGPANSGYTLHDALVDEGFSINETVYKKTSDNTVKRGNSEFGEVDSSIYNQADFNGYTDAAIVVLSRYGGESNDPDISDNYGVPELSFHDQEKAIMEKVKNGGFNKIIVLLNTGYAMDLGWLDDYNVDSCLWIGFPGKNGMKAVAKMIKGEMSPSGALVDTYATNSLSSPAMQNYGDFNFSDLPNVMYHREYLVYAENIYVGYKYYESRYYDQVRGKNNATSSKGVFAGETNWNYASEVMYPFGYGLTYTTFTEKVTSFSWDKENKKVTCKVEVENTGKAAAKDIVELYVSLPYETGMAQKSAIQLIGYTKTNELKAGDKEEVTITVDDYLFATYDENATNGKDTTKKGCYVFDKGDYVFAIGDSAHDALNNVMASQGISGMTDEEGNIVTGDATKAKKETIDTYDNVTYAISPYTGEVVSNQFDQVNYNYYVKDAIDYLTRDDWNTFPKSYDSLKAKDDPTGVVEKYMTATTDQYTTPSDAPSYTTFKHSQEVTTKFIQMKDVAYDDDAKWDAFIDQLKPSELASLYGDAMGYDAMESVSYPGAQGGDGPDGLQGGGYLHPSETLAASTYNLDLLKQRGEFLAEDAMYQGFQMVYGGGCNLHRTPYGGRNFEYYSEDPTVAYLSSAIQAKAMTDGGLISMFKHFCGNDQEVNRHGVATFMTEQALRENVARCFEGALNKNSGSSNMSAYNRLGVISTASYKALMTTLLRDEWGSTGISITDSSKDASTYIFTADAIDAGTDMFNNDTGRISEVRTWLITNRDGNLWGKARKSAKNFFYNMVRSNLADGLDENTEVKANVVWWQPTLIAINVTLGVLALASLVFYILFAYVFKNKEAK